jgi:hypothetical protein
VTDQEDRLRLLEAEIERRLQERFNALRAEFDRMRLEADRRWAGFLERFDQDFSGIVPAELLAEPPRKEEPPPARGGLSLETVRGLDEAPNQVEALHRFLDECRRCASRALLLVARGGALSVWKAIGFSDHQGDDQAARQIVLSVSGSEALSRVLEGEPLRLGAGNEVSSRLGVSDAAQAVLVPMTVKERVSGAVYADTTDSEAASFDPDTITLLTFLAGVTVDRLASRKLHPSPALRAFGSAAEAVREEAPPEEAPLEEAPPEEAPASLGEPSPPSPLVEPEPPPAVEVAEDTAPRAASIEAPSEPEESIAPPPDSFGFSYEAIPTPEPSPPAPERFEPAAPPEPPPARRLGGPLAPVLPEPPQPARRLGGPLAPVEGDERREEARRFARLLVSEIKLYNERAVVEGRRTRNLYERLKDDIDRSRQMYDERIPEDVRAATNFFYEELVGILADGRPEALGL